MFYKNKNLEYYSEEKVLNPPFLKLSSIQKTPPPNFLGEGRRFVF